MQQPAECGTSLLNDRPTAWLTAREWLRLSIKCYNSLTHTPVVRSFLACVLTGYAILRQQTTTTKCVHYSVVPWYRGLVEWKKPTSPQPASNIRHQVQRFILVNPYTQKEPGRETPSLDESHQTGPPDRPIHPQGSNSLREYSGSYHKPNLVDPARRIC